MNEIGPPHPHPPINIFRVNYPPLTHGACGWGPLRGTRLQFNGRGVPRAPSPAGGPACTCRSVITPRRHPFLPQTGLRPPPLQRCGARLYPRQDRDHPDPHPCSRGALVRGSGSGNHSGRPPAPHRARPGSRSEHPSPRGERPRHDGGSGSGRPPLLLTFLLASTKWSFHR